MEQEYNQNQTLMWAAAASRHDRMELLKRIFDILTEDELVQVPNLASKAKKRRKNRNKPKPGFYSAKASASVPGIPASVPETSKLAPEQSHAESTCFSSEVVVKPSTRVAKLGWFRRFSRNDVLALDVEKVDTYISNPVTRKKFLPKAAKVTLVNMLEEIVYQTTIWHANKSYRVTPYTFKINGIGQDTLEDKRFPKLCEVSEALQQLMEGKLIVGIKLLEDLESLELPMGHFETFDLNSHWWRRSLNRDGIYVREDLGLRSLCKHYFYLDMQLDHLPHSDYVDAVWTMRLFRDVYVKLCPEPETKNNDEPSNEIEHFGNLYKKG